MCFQHIRLIFQYFWFTSLKLFIFSTWMNEKKSFFIHFDAHHSFVTFLGSCLQVPLHEFLFAIEGWMSLRRFNCFHDSNGIVTNLLIISILWAIYSFLMIWLLFDGAIQGRKKLKSCILCKLICNFIQWHPVSLSTEMVPVKLGMKQGL
jgi:hypothetical protein